MSCSFDLENFVTMSWSIQPFSKRGFHITHKLKTHVRKMLQQETIISKRKNAQRAVKKSHEHHESTRKEIDKLQRASSLASYSGNWNWEIGSKQKQPKASSEIVGDMKMMFLTKKSKELIKSHQNIYFKNCWNNNIFLLTPNSARNVWMSITKKQKTGIR